KPRAHNIVGTLLGPWTAKRLYFDGRRLGALHPHATLYCCKACGGPLNVEDGPAARKQGCELVPLNAPDFGVVAGDGKDGRFGTLAKRFQILHITIENYPSDSRVHSRFADPRQSGGGQRLEKDGVRPLS